VVVGALVLVAMLVGFGAWALARRFPSVDPASPRTALRVARWEIRHPAVLRVANARLDASKATGLALSLALALAVLGGAVFGTIAFMVRSDTGLAGADRSVATWGADHATDASSFVIDAVTQLGSTGTVVVILALVAVVEYRRAPSRYLVPFLALTALTTSAVVAGIKALAQRVRPDVGVLAPFGGASFPSGHAATAAACFAAIALLVGRRRSPAVHAYLAGGAAAIAAAVAASRVLLGVHWLTDVVAGLAVGWTCFALLSIAFGGRLLQFGAPATIAERAESLGLVEADAAQASDG
jgi:membrane-associated phospholipid phosphatase